MIYPVGRAKKCLSKGVGEYFWFTRMYLYDSCTSVETSRLLLWYGRDFGSNDRQVLLFFSVLLMLYSVCYILVFFIHIALYQNNNPNRLMVTCTKPNWSWNADNDDDSHDNDNDVEAEDGDDDHDDILK